jgi:nucleoid-associated protein YgaU
VVVTASEGTSPLWLGCHPAARRHRAAATATVARAGADAGRLASVAMTRPDRTATLAIVAVLTVVGVACGTTDPASQERLPPIQTTLPSTTTTTTTVAPGDFLYVVQPGDTLFQIAQRFSITVEAIVERNGLASPDDIEAGQSLEIPEGLLVIDDGLVTGTSVP